MTAHRLITIPISHYCEKARWALEWAGIPYTEEGHLQGFHIRHVYRAAKSDSVPVLVTQEGTFGDSTRILKWADSKAPSDHKLYPSDPELRQEVDALEDKFDEKLGVAGRLWMYTYMLDQMPLLLKYTKLYRVPRLEKILMPILFPLIQGKIRSWLRLTPRSREETRLLVDRIFDRTAERLSDGRTYLTGNHFTAADLTFAALSAAVLLPDDYGVSLPRLEELPVEMAEQIRKWRKHPAGQFALKIYRDCRNLKRAPVSASSPARRPV